MAAADQPELWTPTRRSVLSAALGLGRSALLSACSVKSSGGSSTAKSAGTTKIGFVSPRTGPAAGFGEPDGYVLGLAREAFASGLTIGGKKYDVKIIDKDGQSNPQRSAQVANDQINNSGVDLIGTPAASQASETGLTISGVDVVSSRWVCPPIACRWQQPPPSCPSDRQRP